MQLMEKTRGVLTNIVIEAGFCVHAKSELAFQRQSDSHKPDCKMIHFAYQFTWHVLLVTSDVFNVNGMAMCFHVGI